MTKRLIGGLAVGLLTALAAPALLAGPASARVDLIRAGGWDWHMPCMTGSTCRITVSLAGFDRAEPVTLKIDGVVVADRELPIVSDSSSTLLYFWTPPADGTYTVTATQGSSTETATLTIPGDLGGGTGGLSGSSMLDPLLVSLGSSNASTMSAKLGN